MPIKDQEPLLPIKKPIEEEVLEDESSEEPSRNEL
jgi:hypothetical protein